MSDYLGYRTRLSIDILHEEPIPEDFELADIIHEGDVGDYVIHQRRCHVTQITGAAMAEALRNAGSEPDFFSLDDSGRKIEDP
jgi:hypothetical protein